MNNNCRAEEDRKSCGRKGQEFARNEMNPAARAPRVRCLTNQFKDVQLASLASWREANKIFPWDRGGPYIVTQEGCDPDDLTMTLNEFVLGRSGRWLSLEMFFRLPMAERWKEFVFSCGSEVLRMMRGLPSKAVTLQAGPGFFEEIAGGGTDAMATAFLLGHNVPSGPRHDEA